MGMTSQGLGGRRNAVEQESYKRRIKVIGCLGLSRVASQPASQPASKKGRSCIINYLVRQYHSVRFLILIRWR